jgi:hypothetical protein
MIRDYLYYKVKPHKMLLWMKVYLINTTLLSAVVIGYKLHKYIKTTVD